MRLNSMTGLKPLSITAMLAVGANSSFAFNYNDLERNSEVKAVVYNPETSKYINEQRSSTYSEVFMRSYFIKNLEQWKINTLFCSMSKDIITDECFQNIVAMGKNASPLIVEELKKDPSLLVWALNIIYGERISNNPNTTIEDACKLWVKKLSK